MRELWFALKTEKVEDESSPKGAVFKNISLEIFFLELQTIKFLLYDIVRVKMPSQKHSINK